MEFKSVEVVVIGTCMADNSRKVHITTVPAVNSDQIAQNLHLCLGKINAQACGINPIAAFDFDMLVEFAKNKS